MQFDSDIHTLKSERDLSKSLYQQTLQTNETLKQLQKDADEHATSLQTKNEKLKAQLQEVKQDFYQFKQENIAGDQSIKDLTFHWRQAEEKALKVQKKYEKEKLQSKSLKD